MSELGGADSVTAGGFLSASSVVDFVGVVGFVVATQVSVVSLFLRLTSNLILLYDGFSFSNTLSSSFIKSDNGLTWL